VTRGSDDARVSTLELFFDLVFVFTLTQLTALLAADPSAESVAQVLLIFVVLFWMHGGYAWLTNQVPPDRSSRRLLVMLGMAAFFVCALAIPRAFDGGGLAFGLGYLLGVMVHAGMYALVAGAMVVARFAALNLLSALCVTTAGLLDGPAMYGLWIAAVLVQSVTPRVAARVAPRIEVRTAHFVERHGLLLIVAFGESVVAVGIGIEDVSLGPGPIGAAVLGLALAAGLWWAYFVGDEEGAERAMSAASPEDRFRLAINGYFWSFISMLLGVVAIAAGVKLSIGDVAARLDSGPALALAGGVALYLGGEVGFRRVMRIRPVAYRTAAALVALGTVFLGSYLSAAVQLIAIIVTLATTFAFEERWDRFRSEGLR